MAASPRCSDPATPARTGAVELGNDMVLVTIAPPATLLDRRRVALTEHLPTHPYHHEGSWAVGRYRASPWAREISRQDAIALIRRVHRAAAAGAAATLAALEADLARPIAAIAIRRCPALPSGIDQRIEDARAAAMADSVMYRQALAEAASSRGWAIAWYDRDGVATRAARALGGGTLTACLAAMGRAAGPPWQAAHKLAATAAIAAAG